MSVGSKEYLPLNSQISLGLLTCMIFVIGVKLIPSPFMPLFFRFLLLTASINHNEYRSHPCLFLRIQPYLQKVGRSKGEESGYMTAALFSSCADLVLT